MHYPSRPAMSPETRTKNRILRVARGVFAEHGRRRATVREICTKAKVNVAAISYHFGSKDSLYLATLEQALDEHFAAHPVPVSAGADPVERLRGIVRGIAGTILAPRPHWHDRLLMAELGDPSPALDRMVRDYVRPRFEALTAALATLLPGLAPRAIALHALSITGQIFYYKNAHAIALRLLGMRKLTPTLVTQIVEHVIEFSLAAVRGKR